MPDLAADYDAIRLLLAKGLGWGLPASMDARRAKVYRDIVQRAIHLHGILVVTLETPLADWWAGAAGLALADGPTEVHKIQVAEALLKRGAATPGLFPCEHFPTRMAQASRA